MSAPAAPSPAVSVIVVSRHRPGHLAACLHALSLQDHPCWELVLVADPGAAGLRPDLPMKRVLFDEPNISAARNAGLAQAAGDIVAFIDDDAVAEPGWLRHLAAPFANPAVIAAAGFTRGPAGLAWQVRAERIGPDGVGLPLAVPGGAPSLLAPDAGCPVGTLGTNCAFRRDVLAAIGGFDPAFAYHLDESDVNLRLAARWPAALTAVVPAAEVVHGIAPDLRRGPRGVPRDLYRIGLSQALFTRRHGGSVEGIEARHRARLIRHMLAGRLDPFRVGPVLVSLRRGLADGAALPLPPPLPPRQDAPPPFQPMPSPPRARIRLAGWHWQAGRLRQIARDHAAAGQIVTLLLLTLAPLPHRSGLVRSGWWEQGGGLWGASLPGDPLLARWGFAARVDREFARLPALGR